MSNVAAGKDTDDDGESLNDVETTLNAVGVALRSAKGEWKSFETVLDEVAAKWNNGTFNEVERSQIATAIAGVRQQENFRALMNNWDEVIRLTGVAADSTGSSTERMQTYLESIEAKTNNLKNAWEGFIMSLNQSESWNEMLSWLTQLLEKLQYVDWSLVGIIAGGGALITVILKLIPAIKTLIATIKTGGIIAGISSGGIVPLLGLVATAILSIATAWKTANENAEQQIEAIREQKNELEEEEKDVKSLVKTYNDLMSKKGVYGLAEEEKQQLLEVSQKLVETYGFEYDGIDSLTGAYKIAAGAMDDYTEAVERQRRAYSKEEQDKRRTSIDDRLEKLSWNDVEYSAATTARNMGKAFDTELYYSYNKEKSSIISLIQEQMMGILSEEISGTTQNIILEQIKKDASGMTAYDIKEKFTDEYLAKLNDFALKYDNFIEKMSKSEQKYAALIAKNGVLQLEDVEGYKAALEDRLAIYKKMQDEGLISEQEFANMVKQVENEMNSRLDFALKAISESLGENASQFNNVANSLLNFTSELKTGEKGIADYLTAVTELAENIDLQEVFNGNTEAALQFFSTLSTQLTNVLNLISTKYDGGGYASNNDYINDLIRWGESLQRIGTKMTSVEGANKNATGNSKVTSDDKIAEVRQGDQVSYIMSKSTYEKERKNQDDLAKLKAIYDGWYSTKEVDYDTLQKLTGKVILKNQKGYDFFYDRANENEEKYGVHGLSGEDFFEYVTNNLDNGEEIVKRFRELLEEEKKLESEQDKINLWNEATNRYNENNTKIIENDKEVIDGYKQQIEDLKTKRDELQSEYNDIRDNSSVFSLNPIANVVEGKKKDFFGWDYIDEKAKNSHLEKIQGEIDEVNKQIEEYETKLNDAETSEETFETAVEDANAEIQEQESAIEGMNKAANEISTAIKNLKELQDSISAIEGINAGTIVEGTGEFNAAIETIATDVYNSVRDTSGNIKQEYIDIYGETSALFSGTVQELVAAYQKGEITLEEFQSVLSKSIQDNINGLKNGIGDFLIEVGKQFEDFEVTLKITMNTGNIADKIKNAIAGITGQDINVGEIKIASDGISNTLSTLGNAIKNTDLNFDFNYTPNVSGIGGGSGGGKYSPSGGSGSGGSKYTAEDAASDLKDILQDIEGYEADIELDLEDQTEQYINQQMLCANRLDRLKEELDYYNDIYDVTENTSKWLETQNKLLDNQSKKVGKLQNANDNIDAQREKLIKQNSKYDVESWFDSEGNDTLAYGNLINSFEYKKNAIEQDTAAKMRSVYNSVAGSTNKDAIQAAKDRIKQIEEEGDIKIKALEKEQEKVENIHDSVGELNDAWFENQEAIREALAELHEIVISIRDELTDDIMETLENAVDKTNESIEKDVTRMEQLVTVQEKYNSILNDTIDTQDELDSELQASLDSFEYLDEQMRQLMFNEDDYKVLSETLTGIQTDIADIWEEHYNQINSLTEDEMYKAEYITNETERQLEMKMKEYELAKAELNVAKARTNLQNVKNERNVRMFVGGQWIWTADPNAVKDAQQQLADAEREKNKIEREAEQQNLIDEMNQIIDSDNLQIDKNNELLKKIQEAIEAETTEVKTISDALSNAQGEDLPALNDILQGAFGSDGGTFTTLLTEIGESSTKLVELLKGTTTKEAEDLLKGGTLSKKEFEALVKKLGYGWDEKKGIVTTQDGSFSAKYKGWKKDEKKETPLGTADNGASVTGEGKNQTNTQPTNNAGGYPKKGTVSTGSLPLRIRAGAGLNYKVLGTMPKGASVTITGEANSGWAKVQYKGINGYASKQYLTYDQGGLATGKGIFLKDINVPERVLSPQQTKSFDTLVKNLTTNPVLAALTKNIKGTSSLNGLGQGSGETKQYYFSNFTVQADNITEFIDSLEGMIPISGK